MGDIGEAVAHYEVIAAGEDIPAAEHEPAADVVSDTETEPAR